MGFRPLEPLEEAAEESVLRRWDLFIFHLQEAREFVTAQRDVVPQTLDGLFQVPLLFLLLAISAVQRQHFQHASLHDITTAAILPRSLKPCIACFAPA